MQVPQIASPSRPSVSAMQPTVQLLPTITSTNFFCMNVTASADPHRQTSLASRIRKSFARAKEVITHSSPPPYNRGAWGIVNDIPYPPPPPYAGGPNPPTYEQAMEIGVVASPLRAQEQRMRRSRSAPASVANLDLGAPEEDAAPQAIQRSSSTSQLESVGVDAAALIGGPDEELVPRYESPAVSQWALGESLFEKPPLHPRGYRRHL